jgi:hypothetical protein
MRTVVLCFFFLWTLIFFYYSLILLKLTFSFYFYPCPNGAKHGIKATLFLLPTHSSLLQVSFLLSCFAAIPPLFFSPNSLFHFLLHMGMLWCKMFYKGAWHKTSENELNLNFRKFNYVVPRYLIRIFFCEIFCKPNISFMQINVGLDKASVAK